MQYSCAYFSSPDMSLEEAQEAKKRHIAAKLLLRPGMRVLEIGSGWGGLAISLAQQADVKVLGITLSTEQLTLARERAAALGLQDRVTFELADYRTLQGRFDRVVSVGMFEHVGTPQYQAFLRRRRAADGAERRRARPCDRTQPGHLQAERLDQQVHLSRRLYPGLLRSHRAP